MSAQFILEYAGAPVRFGSAGAQLVTEAEADKFISEADAWQTARANALPPPHCRVINIYARQQAERQS